MGRLARYIHKKKNPSEGHIESLCWTCIHAVPSKEKGTGCSWSRSIGKVPVKGSQCKEKAIYDKSKKDCKSVLKIMTECPEYQQDVKAGR